MQREIESDREADRSQPVGPDGQQTVDVEEPLVWQPVNLKKGILGTLGEATNMLIQVIYQDMRNINKQIKSVRKF